MKNNRMGSAAELLRRALDVRERTLGADDVDVAENLGRLAKAQRGTCTATSSECEDSYRRKIQILEKHSQKLYPDVAAALEELAFFLHFWAGKSEETIVLCERALEIREQEMGIDHPDCSDSMNNLAWFYGDVDKYRQSESLYVRILAIKEKAYSPHHPEVTKALVSLAALYAKQGKYADPLFQRILTNVGDRSDLNAADSLLELGYHFCHYDQAEKGIALCERSLAIREGILGRDHPALEDTLEKLRTQYLFQMKTDSLVAVSERLVAIHEKSVGCEHAKYAASLVDLADAYTSFDRADDAEKLYLRSLEIYEKILGTDHNDLVNSLRCLGAHYWRQEKYEKAAEFYERNVRILGRETRPLMMPFLLGAISVLVTIYIKMNRLSDAEALCHRMLDLHATNPEVYGSLSGDVRAQLEQIEIAKAQVK
jgi:tetratricopeptide (TPR) repeat protein